MADKRLAQGLTDPKPRQWRPSERYQLYGRGFRDGAACRAIDTGRYEGLEDYDQGYHDGTLARGKAMARYAKKLGYKPSVLRAESAYDAG